MNYTIFKPNPKNTGGLVNLKIATTKNDKKDKWEKTLFAEFVPQKTWDDSKKFGTFDRDKRKSIVLNVNEAGEIINSIENVVPFQSYHKKGDSGTWIKFGNFEKSRKIGKEGDKGYWEGKLANFALGISGKGFSISVPIEPGEAKVLCNLLNKYIEESLTLEAKENDKKWKEKQGSSDNNSAEEESHDEEDESVEEEEDDDIPF